MAGLYMDLDAHIKVYSSLGTLVETDLIIELGQMDVDIEITAKEIQKLKKELSIEYILKNLRDLRIY